MGGPDKGKFGLDPTDRQLIATGPHAYNDKNTYQVIITATDLAGRSATVTIDATPSGGQTNPVVQGPSIIKYPENGTWQAATYTGTIADRTRDDVGWIISVVPGGCDGDFFDIDDDGVLTFAQPPDYEDGQRTYSFSIYAYDSNPPKGSSGATFYRVKVTVYDVDDLPEIDGPSAVDHPENTSEVHEYTVSGVDAGETVTWSPLSGADGGKFSLTDGLLAFVSPPDFETPASSAGANVYLVTIMVEVGSEMKTEDVRVTNVNEPPEFPSATTTCNVDENAEGGENIVGPVEATDPDADASLTYTLSGTYAASFSVVNYSGQLQTKAGVDYGAKSSHTVTVTATDPGGLTDTITVTITTSEENDAPVFDDTSLQTTLEVAENSPANTNVGSPITATDEDSNSLTYTLEGTGTDKDSFIIDNSGQIQTKSGETYDFEAKASYSVTVKADDTIDVTIAVTNVEEAGAVTFDLTQPEAGIPLVATVTDPDGNVYTVTWEWLISDSANTGFNAISGQTLNSYTPTAADVGKYLKAKASYTDPEDSGKTAESATTAAVTPGNTPPTFPDTGGTPNPMTFNIEENSVAATVVGTVSTTDSDSGDIPTYSLEGAPTQKDAFNAAFDLDTSTGAITVLADDSLDHETTPSYTFQVGVSDGKDAADQTDSAIDSTVSVTINVTDINEPPMFPDSENRLRTVAENTEAGQPVGDPFAATDPDEGATLTYILRVTDAASFEIDSSSGQLKTKAALDYETTPSYSVTVSVRDSKDDSGVSDTVTDDTIEVTITVTNVEEDGTVTFTNRTPQARIELTASVADPDVIIADSVIWQWAISDTSGSNFADISGETNASYTPDDNDVGKYLRATATYTDGHGAAKTASGDSLAVSVAHNPNQPPTFTDDPNNHPITFSIAENTPAGQDIGTPVTATDPDPTDTIAYSLDPTYALVFQIGSANGQIQTEAALNFEATPSYTVTVTATDPSNTTGTVVVTINVTDVDEPPGKPDAPNVTAKTGTHDALTVTWVVPDNTGSAITSYAFQYRKHDVEGWTSETIPTINQGNPIPTTADITGLLPDTEYLARVQATNDEGTGEWSDQGAGTTAVKPEAGWFELTVDYGAATYDVTERSSVDITVTLSKDGSPQVADRKLAIPITVTLETAESGDYTAGGLDGGNALAFVSGESSKAFTITANSDEDTDDETLDLGFGTLPDKVTAGATAAATVTINDQIVTLPQRTVSYGAASYTVAEGGNATINVTLSQAADRALSVPITVTRGTAEASDYEVSGLTGGAVAFSLGASSGSFTITAAQDTDSANETLSLGFGTLPSGVSAGSRATASVTITDDDPAVVQSAPAAAARWRQLPAARWPRLGNGFGELPAGVYGGAHRLP